jgi:mono/diheme cytochrome c family protein
MRQRRLLVLSALVLGVGTLPISSGRAAELTPAERGRDLMFHRSLNPPVWSIKAYENVWTQWGLADKPADFRQAFLDRYGLHAAPNDESGRPLGLLEASALLKRGLVNNCLLCHASTVAGQLIIGLGNASLDLQTLFEELSAADGYTLQLPYQFSYVRGTIDPINPVTFLMEFRDSELNVIKRSTLEYSQNVCSRPPAWWQIKRKQTRDWTGSIDAHSTRVDMVNLLTPLNSAAKIKKHESDFADISAYLLTIEAPGYPFPVDTERAQQGRGIFAAHCAKCHGTYGPEGKYPNKIVPLGVIETDRTLALAASGRLIEIFNKSWFAREPGPDGRSIHLAANAGYQAPPLDGIWATGPYFHNGSVPTVYQVLKSSARPRIFTRSYRTGREDYDPVRLGVKVTVLDQPAGAGLSGYERRKIYDTTQPGRGNGGHTFGDELNEDERLAVIEYLKTL